jgi:hypothetical protein
MRNYIRMWKITTTMQIIIIWIIKYFSLKFIPCRFYIWKIAKTKSLSHVFKKEYLNYEYAHEQVQHSSKPALMMKHKKFMQVCNPNVQGLFRDFLYTGHKLNTKLCWLHVTLGPKSSFIPPLKTFFHSSSYAPNFTRLMFPVPNSHDFMKNFNIQWNEYFYLLNGYIHNWGFKKEKNSMTILKGFFFQNLTTFTWNKFEMRKIEYSNIR